MTLVRLSELCAIRSGGTPARNNSAFYGGHIPWAKISDIEASDGVVYRTEEAITHEGLAAIRGRLFPRGTLLFAIYGSIGKMAFAGQELSTNQAILGIENLRPDALCERYLFRYLESRRDALLSAGAGITQKNLSAGYVRDIEIPLLPLEQQKRIAAILDQADDLRRKRQRALDRLGQLGQAIFTEMFGDLTRNDKAWPTGGTLGDYAEITSGITKGRDPKGRSTRLVPYLAVVNVQDKRLQLDAPKEIEATEDEILRYRLQSGDLLLTEGGDPDKLGRGTLWNAELPECIHQNHVFRVRLSSKKYNPTFLNWLVGSAYGKQYFLRAAKQTTGIASINMSQLKAFPMLLPPFELQEDFQRKLDHLRVATEVLVAGVRSSENLFHSLQHRAFTGELTASSLKEAAV